MQTSEGELQIELLAKEAPNECKAFVELCNAGAFEFSSIYRIIPGFMIQAGKKGTASLTYSQNS